MTLQQLRYLIAIANHGSISAAAHTLYVSQSSLSVAVRDIERETGVTIFERSNRGITLTSDGIELLGYARQVVEQADLMEQRYSGRGGEAAQRLSITSQHYAFVVEAFLELAEEYEGAGYNFSLRETRTSEVIEDVRDFRSDLGVLYLSTFNESVIGHAISDANLSFNLLFTAQPHVFCQRQAPLASRTEVTVEGSGGLPPLRLRAGGEQLVLLLRGALGRAAPQKVHLRKRPRHPLEPARAPQRLHHLHRRALQRDVHRHRQRAIADQRAHARGLHRPQ